MNSSMGWTKTVLVNNSPLFVNKSSNALAHNDVRRSNRSGKNGEAQKGMNSVATRSRARPLNDANRGALTSAVSKNGF